MHPRTFPVLLVTVFTGKEGCQNEKVQFAHDPFHYLYIVARIAMSILAKTRA
jgi:hypothetical protein